MDSLLGRDPGSHVYGVVAGGIRDQTPTCFLYSYKRNYPTVWEYLGPLANIGHNYRPSRWSGDFGVSWEVCNFFSLQDTQFMVVNAEGCDVSTRYLKETLPPRPIRQALWMAFELVLGSQGEPKMVPSFSGILDHGCYYAAVSFFDPVGCQRILWGKHSSPDFQTSVLANMDFR
jgi:beta-fructofuranosidase